MNKTYLMVPVKPVKHDLVSEIDKFIHVPLATYDTYGSVKIGSGLIVNRGVVSFDEELIPTDLSELNQDSEHRLVTDSQIEYWNDKVDVSELNKYYTKTESDSLLNEKTDNTITEKLTERVVNNETNINVLTQNKANKSDIIDNLTTNNANQMLSARQGYRLNNMINDINALLKSDNINLDTIQEIVNYIENNKDLIDSIMLTKVNISDVIDNLTTTDSTKPLSANQGVVLKEFIDALPEWAKQPTKPTYYYSEILERPAQVRVSVSKVGIPTKTSQLTNDSNFITDEFVEDAISAIDYTEIEQRIDGVANSIPTKVGQLENDSNFATESFVENAIPNNFVTTDTDQYIPGIKTFDSIEFTDNKINIGLSGNNVAKYAVLIGYAGEAESSSVGVGSWTNVDVQGVAVGPYAETEGLNGVAVGFNAKASEYSVAIGEFANSTTHSIQLGKGTNSNENTLQIYDYQLLDANGKIPEDRLLENIAVTDQNNNFTTSQTINGTLTINGDIVQNGTSYETHAEQVYTTNDIIILREGAVGGLVDGKYAGFEAVKYDGENVGVFGFGADGVARVGDKGNEQPLLTREESSDLIDGEVMVWNAANNRAEGSSAFVKTTDKAVANGEAGLIALGTSGTGVYINKNGKLEITPTTDEEIESETTSSRRCLMPQHVSTVVKKGMTNNLEEWTEDDKRSARTLIGVQSALDEIDSRLDGVMDALSFTDYETMISYFNISALERNVKLGQSVYIVSLGVPDLWVSGEEEYAVHYEYTTDEDFVAQLKANNYVQIGYYRLSALETDKVDLANYVTFDDKAELNGHHGLVMLGGSANGLNISKNDTLYVVGVRDDEIESESTSSYRCLQAKHISPIVKKGLTNSKVEWTEDEKKSARDLLGVTELVGDINTALESMLGV